MYEAVVEFVQNHEERMLLLHVLAYTVVVLAYTAVGYRKRKERRNRPLCSHTLLLGIEKLCARIHTISLYGIQFRAKPHRFTRGHARFEPSVLPPHNIPNPTEKKNLKK